MAAPFDRQQAYRWRRQHGRLVLKRFHVADVELPQKLIALGRLDPSQEDNAEAVREAAIQLLDDLCVGATIEVKR